VALVPGANLLVLGTSEGGFATVDLTNGEVRNTAVVSPRTTPLADLVALSGGLFASLAPKGNEYRIWEAKTGIKRQAPARFPDLPAGTGEVRAAISPDGKWVAAGRVGQKDAPLRVAPAQNPKAPLVDTSWNGGTVHFTSDGTRVLVPTQSSQRWEWFHLPSGKSGGVVDFPPRSQIKHLSSDGARVALVSDNGDVRRERLVVRLGDTGAVLRALPVTYSVSRPVALSPDGKRLAAIRTAGPDAPAVELIDVDAGTRVASAQLESSDVSALELAPDGKSLYVVSQKAGTVWAFTVPAAPKP
jgi:hypothetical protein